jgi:hypothetical protein
MLALKAFATVFILYDGVTIHVRCFQFLLGSFEYKFQMRAPCPVFCVFQVSCLVE